MKKTGVREKARCLKCVPFAQQLLSVATTVSGVATICYTVTTYIYMLYSCYSFAQCCCYSFRCCYSLLYSCYIYIYICYTVASYICYTVATYMYICYTVATVLLGVATTVSRHHPYFVFGHVLCVLQVSGCIALAAVHTSKHAYTCMHTQTHVHKQTQALNTRYSYALATNRHGRWCSKQRHRAVSTPLLWRRAQPAGNAF